MAVDVGALRDRVTRYFERDIWQRHAAPRSRLAALGRSALQVFVIAVQGFERDQILLRATALTYFAMLSLIPILAMAIGLVGAFGVSDELARFVVERVAAGSPEAGQYILDLVKKVNFASFGAIGGAGVFVTTVLALTNVEKAFNKIWGIERERTLMRRFADYLAVLVIAPLLFTAAVSLSTSLRSPAFIQ
jgi:membrane protein